jgi:CYTH domain-containing protein
MVHELEIEVTYLAAALPEGLANCKHADIEDIYLPATAAIPKVRLRRKQDAYEFTKKSMSDPNDKGQQHEQNISLTAEEYAALAKGDGRKVTKTRYLLPYHNLVAEIDVFQGPLAGLVLVEFEFPDLAAKQAFVMPDFGLADVTQEDFIAGGALAGRSYADIADNLKFFGYKPLQVA